MPELIQYHQWQPGERPRVLVEAVEWGTREHAAAVLREHGYDAVTCPGPEGAGQRCRLAAGEGCSAVEGVDVYEHACGLTGRFLRLTVDNEGDTPFN